MTGQSTSHVVIGNQGRPIHRDTVINRLHEAGFTVVIQLDVRLLPDINTFCVSFLCQFRTKSCNTE